MTPWTIAHQGPLSMGILQTRILEWVAMPSSRGSSQPRDRTQVSCIAGGFFAIWANFRLFCNSTPMVASTYLPHPAPTEPKDPAFLPRLLKRQGVAKNAAFQLWPSLPLLPICLLMWLPFYRKSNWRGKNPIEWLSHITTGDLFSLVSSSHIYSERYLHNSG